MREKGCSVYNGTKAYNYIFSDTIFHEAEGKIDVLSVHPTWVKTNLTAGFTSPKLWTITAQQCASGALNALGY